MSENIRRVGRELKYKGAILDVYTDHMEFENGNKAEWDFIKHKGAAAVVAVDKDGRLIMVRQYRNALDRYTLEIPAGALGFPGGPERSCAGRELEEETGFHCEKLDWLINIRTTVAFCNEKIEVYVARDLIPSHQNLDEDEYIELERYTVEELKEKIFQGEIEDSKTIASILAYDAKYCR